MIRLNGKQYVADGMWKFWEITDGGNKLKLWLEQDGIVLEERTIDASAGETFDPTKAKHIGPYVVDKYGNYDELAIGEKDNPKLGMLSVAADPENDYGVEWVDIAVRRCDMEIVEIYLNYSYSEDLPKPYDYFTNLTDKKPRKTKTSKSLPTSRRADCVVAA